MPLDPQAQAWLDAGLAAGARPYQELGAEEARRVVEAGAVELFGVVETVGAVEDTEVRGVPVRVYRPQGDAGGALVWLHGGGWVVASLETHDPLCRALAARSGRDVVSVGYRLAPEHPHPAALEDAWGVLEWASGAFDRVAVGGDSAGGHLAAVAARWARDRGVELALQVLVVPVTDCSFDTRSYLELGTGYGLERTTMEWFWSLYLQGLAAADDPDVSPLRAPDLSGVAPALVLTAEYDPLRDEGEAYAARLRAAGVPVEHSRYAGMVHGFFRMPAVFDRSHDAIDRVALAVRDALRAADISGASAPEMAK